MKVIKFILESILELGLAMAAVMAFAALFFLAGFGHYELAMAIAFAGLTVWLVCEMRIEIKRRLK